MASTPSLSAVTAAISKAKSTTKWAIGMCDNFVANMYGFSASGYNTATDNWKATPSSLKHPGDMNAPAGALMYWSGGDGHVAISLGNGSIVSTDISGNGTVSTVPASAITQKWGKAYVGWAYPYFQGKEATGTLGAFTGSTSATNTSEQTGLLGSLSINPEDLAKGFINEVAKPFEDLLSAFLWGTEILIGIGLMTVGIYMAVRIR